MTSSFKIWLDKVELDEKVGHHPNWGGARKKPTTMKHKIGHLMGSKGMKRFHTGPVRRTFLEPIS